MTSSWSSCGIVEENSVVCQSFHAMTRVTRIISCYLHAYCNSQWHTYFSNKWIQRNSFSARSLSSTYFTKQHFKKSINALRSSTSCLFTQNLRFQKVYGENKGDNLTIFFSRFIWLWLFLALALASFLFRKSATSSDVLLQIHIGTRGLNFQIGDRTGIR